MHKLLEESEKIVDGETRLVREQLIISFLVYNCDKSKLEKYLDEIFNHNHSINFEVVICDDATSDGSWDVSCRVAKDFKDIVTLRRNRHRIGPVENRLKGRLLCRGKYCIEISKSTQFDIFDALSVIKEMDANKSLKHPYISKLKSGNYFLPPASLAAKKNLNEDKDGHPLVSICIYNYNYGRYLRQCFESVFSQTYSNIEICFSDNASTDESWDIALEYVHKYPGKVNLIRNRQNFGAHVNAWNCMMDMQGKYVLKLCSDDAIQPEMIGKCVWALESNPDAAFTMVHREIIDENNNSTVEPSFYEQSCLIPGAEQAAVYMMSSVNPSVSQIFYNVEKADGKRMTGNLNDRWFGDRIMDFHMCCDSPIIYIKEPLLLNRVHPESDSSSLDNNLLQCLGEYVLVHQLADIATAYNGLDKATSRLPSALDKLGSLCLRYCLKGLVNGEEINGQRYFHLAQAIFPQIQQDELYKRLADYWSINANEREKLLQKLLKDFPQSVKREVSYPIPIGSIPF